MLIILPCHLNAVLVCVIFIIKHRWGGTCVSKFHYLRATGLPPTVPPDKICKLTWQTHFIPFQNA